MDKEYTMSFDNKTWKVDLKKNQSREFRIYDDYGYKTVRITYEILEKHYCPICERKLGG